MKKEKLNKGFTLLEMLVVVLIIGILAGIALPQYQSAVRKARVAEAKLTLRALIDATDRYYLATQEQPPHDFNELDVGIPTESTNWSFILDDWAPSGYWAIAIPKWENDYDIEYISANYDGGGWEGNGKFICYADNDNGHKICKSLGGKLVEWYEDSYQL